MRITLDTLSARTSLDLNLAVLFVFKFLLYPWQTVCIIRSSRRHFKTLKQAHRLFNRAYTGRLTITFDIVRAMQGVDLTLDASYVLRSASLAIDFITVFGKPQILWKREKKNRASRSFFVVMSTTNLNTNTHTRTHTNVVLVCVSVCVYMCVRVCGRVCVGRCVCVWVGECM